MSDENLDKTQKRLKSTRERIKKCSEISPEEVEKIFAFEEECKSQGLSDRRTLYYLKRLKKLCEWTEKDFHTLNKKDIKRIIGRVEKSEFYHDEYSEKTKKAYKISTKKFFQWLANENTDENYEWKSRNYPKKVEWIRTTARKEKLNDPVILTREEIKEIFKAADGILEKSMSTFMYESGCRSPDELLKMKVKDILELKKEENNGREKYSATVKLRSGKVGTRKITIVFCVPYLHEWLENKHPNPEQDTYLWINDRGRREGKRVNYKNLRTMVKRWAKDADIKKEVTPYTFRRTRYTHLAPKWPTPVLYKYMGQVQGSDAIERYLALSNQDVENTVMEHYGMESGNGNNEINPMFCPNCGNQNPPEYEFCKWCEAPLTDKAKAEEREEKKESVEDMVEGLIEEKMEELAKN